MADSRQTENPLAADVQNLVDFEGFATMLAALYDLAKARGEAAVANSRQRGAHLYLADALWNAMRIADNLGI